MKIVRFLIVALGVACILSVAIALSARDQWWITALDYPRLQIAIASAAVLLLSFALLNWKRLWTKLYVAALIAAVAYQGYILAPYLLPVTPTVPTRPALSEARTFSVMTANVKMENEQVQPFLDTVAQYEPDVLLVIETNERWIEALEPLDERYAHKIEQPQSNHYGMALYSQLPLSDTEISYFESDETPSIRTTLQLPSGDEVRFYGLHPRPPLPSNSITPADKELIKVANLTNEQELPVVAAGDFNDVPWSFTIDEFERISQLRDIRIGRGIYNTYDMQNPILRLPIDHVYISPGLGLVELEPPITFESDHAALYVELIVDETVE